MDIRPKSERNKEAVRPTTLIAGSILFVLIVLSIGALTDPFLKPFDSATGRLDDIFDYLFQDLFGTDPAPPVDRKVVACAQTCEKIVQCGLLDDAELCVPWCADEWTAETRDCIERSACDRIDAACFPKTDRAVCEDVCAHAAECAWMAGDAASCLNVCLSEWGRGERDCLLSTECPDDPEFCISQEKGLPCPSVCDKLDACGQIDTEEFPACVSMCEEEMDAAERDCILGYECGEMAAVCIEGKLPEELCAEACAIATDCEFVSMTERECALACEEEWNEDLALCIVENETCEDAVECFAEPGVPCSEFCRFLIDCGQLEEVEYDACVSGCPDEFTEEERGCVLASDCSTAEECLKPAQAAAQRHADCPAACSKLSSCRLIPITEQLDCVDECLEDWTDLKLNCVLTRECKEIGGNCLSSPPTSP